MSDLDVADVMQEYANAAIEHSKRCFNVTLDYSERSLEAIDRILEDYTKDGLIDPEELSSAEEEELWTFCTMMGGYVGEVIIRNIGGNWQTKDISEGDVSIKLVSGGVEGSPPETVWRTFTEPYKTIVSYYRGLRAILGHGDETIENGIRTVQLPQLSEKPPKQASGLEKRPWWKLW